MQCFTMGRHVIVSSSMPVSPSLEFFGVGVDTLIPVGLLCKWLLSKMDKI